MQDLVSEFPPGYLAEFADELAGTIPAEKAMCDLRQAQIARVMQATGSLHIPGVGQKIAEIDPRLYFRMLHEAGGDPNFLDDYLADNPQLCAPGYNPRRRKVDLRHGRTFVGGKPV